ncbi:MAG TPA: fatty acyl-AMP ligase [Thiohalobacter sp.]|nr:fatty acyl-AMP ligase [Thiohalobacter sp.]
MQPTGSSHDLALRPSTFSTLCEALDYAAGGETGVNFYNGRGELYCALSYGELREQSRELARRLLGLGMGKGDRVALVAETTPDFVRFFWACQYAGLVPVPLPATVHIGGHQAFVNQLRKLLENCRAEAAMAPEEWLSFLQEATEGLELRCVGTPDVFDALDPAAGELPGAEPQDTAYIQYTSGSTRFPRGVVIDHTTVLANINDMALNGLKLNDQDRFGSWLPFYHDMGLVAFIIMPMATQRSVDFLGTRDFAMRPRQWLELMSRNRATITSAPPFGYDLAAMRVRASDAEKWDLSNWRVACVGAELISPEPLQRFAEALAPAGFDPRTYVACYGMAECSLAISFAPLGEEMAVDCIDAEQLQQTHEARPVDPTAAEREGVRVAKYVDCGPLLPTFEVSIRDDDGQPLPERHVGSIHLRGPSVMSGYFEDEASTREVMTPDGWLNTGDVGYLVDGNLVVTGRKKDMIIVHGRNIWPQDLEYLAKQQPGVRFTDAAAFAVTDENQHEAAVLVVQCRERDPARRDELVKNIKGQVRAEFGIDCMVELVPPRTLPRTSSGKLARSRARQEFLARCAAEAATPPQANVVKGPGTAAAPPVEEGRDRARRLA